MRMWMINPSLLCDKHLLGEHFEIHKLIGCLKKRKSIQDIFDKKLIDPKLIYKRHSDLVKEMNNNRSNNL